MKQRTASKKDDGAVEMLVIPIGTSVSIHGEAGGVVTARSTMDGLELFRHKSITSEVMFLTLEG